MRTFLRLVLISFVISTFVLITQCEEKNETVGMTAGLYNKYTSNKNEHLLTQKLRLKPSNIFQDLWTGFSNTSLRFFKKIVPNRIQKFFSKCDENEEQPTTYNPETSTKDNKEHGRFDNIGRDIIRGIQNTIGKIEEQFVYTPSEESRGLDCNKTFFGGAADGFKNKIKAIYPGTQWCGGGNKARDIDDLGEFAKTDNCCREHDFCSDSIDAGATKYGLRNTGLFTRSNCECDGKFFDCLKKSRSIVSTKIGHTYFTILGPQCFKKDYKIIKCAKSNLGKCSDYEQERSGEQIYQWFDSPVFF